MHFLIATLALLTQPMCTGQSTRGDCHSFAADQRATVEIRLAQRQSQAQEQDDRQHKDELRDLAAARVKQCLDGAQSENNPLLSGQMCVAVFYLRDVDFRAGFDMMLEVVDPTTAQETRDLLQQLIGILQTRIGAQGE